MPDGLGDFGLIIANIMKHADFPFVSFVVLSSLHHWQFNEKISFCKKLRKNKNKLKIFKYKNEDVKLKKTCLIKVLFSCEFCSDPLMKKSNLRKNG